VVWNRDVLFTTNLDHAMRKSGGGERSNYDKLNGTHQLQVYADDDNLLWENINTTKRNTEAVTATIKDVGLEVNIQKSLYLVIRKKGKAII
jgi:hypothetical protein